MKTTQYFSLVPALTLLSVSPLLAQETGEAMGETQRQAEELRLPSFVKASIGADAVVSNEEEHPLGVVRDHVIDFRSGKVLYVAVGAADDMDEPARLVPFRRFSWNPDGRLLLPLTEEELAALPEYDPEHLPPLEGHVAFGESEDSGIEDMPAGQGKPVGEGRIAPAGMEHSNLALSSVLGSDIMAVQDSFAAVRELILEPNQGMIAFVLADGDAAQDDPYLIPWKAMTWQAPGEEGMQGHFALALTKEALEEAPTLERADMAHLKNRKTIEATYDFYKLTPPFANGSDGPRG